MVAPDFGGYYAALGLDPSATDQDIVRAKRAYNELYHSDRLAHMSEQARAIAAEKVRAANEAAQVLLDPANRAARDQWCRTSRRDSDPKETHRDGPTTDSAGPRPGAAPASEHRNGWAPSSPSAPPVRGSSSTARLVLAGLTAGAALGTIAVVRGTREAATAAAPGVPPTGGSPGEPADPEPRARRPAPRGAPVTDSIVELPGDGRWTRPVATGGPGFRVSFMPESEATLYRVRGDGTREQVLLGEPGFRKPLAPAQRYEFSSLTGNPARLRFSRWRVGESQGRPVHTLEISLDPAGAWSRKVYPGELEVRWEPDRAVVYEAQDDRGRSIRMVPSVRSVYFEAPPQWIRFRSVDSQPLTLAVRYTTR